MARAYLLLFCLGLCFVCTVGRFRRYEENEKRSQGFRGLFGDTEKRALAKEDRLYEDLRNLLEKRDQPSLCKLPAETGMCRAHFPMYYYNSNSGNCEEFVYGGCGGNDNQFGTKQECLAKCG